MDYTVFAFLCNVSMVMFQIKGGPIIETLNRMGSEQ